MKPALKRSCMVKGVKFYVYCTCCNERFDVVVRIDEVSSLCRKCLGEADALFDGPPPVVSQVNKHVVPPVTHPSLDDAEDEAIDETEVLDEDAD